MAKRPLHSQIAEFPTELSLAVCAQAERDASNVVVFLTAAGLKKGALLPREFLLDLGAALRLVQWEQAGISLHVHAGLPCAVQALRDVLAVAKGQAGPDVVEKVHNLVYQVEALFVEQFAWNGSLELDADVTLEPPDEAALLEGLADFLWDCRPE